MNYRTATLLAKKAYSADAVEVIPIRVKQPISQIQIFLKLQSQGYSAGTIYAMPVEAITKIELVKGSDVLCSLTGSEAQAIDFYHNKRETQGETRFMNDGWSNVTINLNFGRFLYDPILALDPLKFENLQLIITLDISAGACNSDNAYITVLAHIFDEKVITPVGFLQHTRVKSYNLVDAGHEYTPMPRDYPYRKLFIKALRGGTNFNAQIDRIKLSEDQDRRVIINELTDEVLAMVLGGTPPYREFVLGSGNTNSGLYWCTPGMRARIVAIPWRNTHQSDTECAAYGVNGGRFILDQGVATNWQANIEGFLPHGVMELPFGLQDEIDDWFDVTKVGSLILDITGGESTGTCEILLQQLRSY